jgi:hypothetical protein
LRGRGQLRQAIALVEATAAKIPDKEDSVAVLVQGLYAAQEIKDEQLSRQFATQILAIDPAVPSAKQALGLC